MEGTLVPDRSTVELDGAVRQWAGTGTDVLEVF